jgi:hypothetical protein
MSLVTLVCYRSSPLSNLDGARMVLGQTRRSLEMSLGAASRDVSRNSSWIPTLHSQLFIHVLRLVTSETGAKTISLTE